MARRIRAQFPRDVHTAGASRGEGGGRRRSVILTSRGVESVRTVVERVGVNARECVWGRGGAPTMASTRATHAYATAAGGDWRPERSPRASSPLPALSRRPLATRPRSSSPPPASPARCVSIAGPLVHFRVDGCSLSAFNTFTDTTYRTFDPC